MLVFCGIECVTYGIERTQKERLAWEYLNDGEPYCLVADVTYRCFDC